jgi:hypothetical protein
MLVREPSHNRSKPNGQGSVVNVLSGHTLRRLLWGKTPAERARICAQLLEHNVNFADLLPAQVARLCEANPSAVTVALGHAGKRGPHQRTLDHLVKRYGPAVLTRALDQVTAPEAE